MEAGMKQFDVDGSLVGIDQWHWRLCIYSQA